MRSELNKREAKDDDQTCCRMTFRFILRQIFKRRAMRTHTHTHKCVFRIVQSRKIREMALLNENIGKNERIGAISETPNILRPISQTDLRSCCPRNTMKTKQKITKSGSKQTKRNEIMQKLYPLIISKLKHGQIRIRIRKATSELAHNHNLFTRRNSIRRVFAAAGKKPRV